MKLPNGYGSVTKMSGTRRNPWRVRKFDRYEMDDAGKLRQIFINVGYYRTKSEAMAALAAYNATGKAEQEDVKGLTLGEVYQKWSLRKYEQISDSQRGIYKSSWNITPERIATKPMARISFEELQGVIDTCGKSKRMASMWKALMGQLWEYAVRLDVITPDRDKTNYLDTSMAGKIKERPHKRITPEELAKLWAMEGKERDIALLLIYSGCRPSEVLNLTGEDVDLAGRVFRITKAKTEAGVRSVPIAKKTLPIWERYWKPGKIFDINADQLSASFPLSGHTGYDCRHTCISMMAEAGIDERIIQKIVGHKGQTITRAIYTHVELAPMLEAIDKI